MKKKRVPYTSWKEDYDEKMKDPEFRALAEKARQRLELAYSIAEMRYRAKLSQKAMAEKLKISQAAVARIESGSQNLTIGTLMKVGDLFGKKLKIRFV